MGIAAKARAAVNIVKHRGVPTLLGEMAWRAAPRLPAMRRLKWNIGIGSETAYWDDLLGHRREEWPDDVVVRLDPEYPLQARARELLPGNSGIATILDVGAGPMTYLGKVMSGRRLDIVAIDPLAEMYSGILAKHRIHPPVATIRLAAEEITRKFAGDSFDLVTARNCLDHSYDPEDAIMQMVEVVRPDCYVLLEHWRNEATENGYEGMHQWDFDVDVNGHFLIRSRGKTIDMTERHSDICAVMCEITYDGNPLRTWLVIRIRKRS